MDEVCSVVSGIAKKKNINLVIRISDDVTDITADKQKFKQVLYNLLSNAIKFTNEHGRVEVITEADNSRLSIHVKDTGIGISSAGMNQLFMPFIQLDSSVSRKHDGTGLGLALTKKLVELQKGNISVKSELSKGSTFTVVLPKYISMN